MTENASFNQCLASTGDIGPGCKYPPLSQVRKTLRVSWYRCNLPPEQLRQLLKRSDWQGFLQAGGHFLLWLTTASCVYWSWSEQNWWLMVLAMWLHGTVSSFFNGTAPHELGHGTVFKTPWLNRVFLYLFSTISWWDPFDYASSHTYHHRYTLHPEGDRENLLPLTPSTSPAFLLQLATLNLLTDKGRTFGKGGLLATVVATIKGAQGKVGTPETPSNEWLDAIHQDQPAEHRRSIIWSRYLLVFHTLVLLLSLASGYWVFILIITLAPFTANLLSYLVGITQHCGLKENDPDFRKCTRSITLNPFLEFLYWRMNWHTEHHMFAGVPCYNLKKLHHAVASQMPRPRSLREAWAEMITTWKIQQQDPGYYHDTPVPTPAHVPAVSSATEGEASIGELAPSGLKE